MFLSRATTHVSDLRISTDSTPIRSIEVLIVDIRRDLMLLHNSLEHLPGEQNGCLVSSRYFETGSPKENCSHDDLDGPLAREGFHVVVM